ncbi:MAG TPA: non-homologous end-joining DNA ligase [Solirubrobacteraceae bacterium]|nr:non-homologous end-joining DNA ligase [Solirubrobacteraceae bacterium]
MSVAIRAGRRTVEIPRPDKVLFPPGITKAQLAEYYEQISPQMLPHLARRPLNYERFPDGIGGPRIFQQHASGHFPAWIGRVEVPARKGTVEHVVARDGATLVYLAGQACITFHRWLSRADKLDRPDLLVIDLDPSIEDPAEIRGAALTFGSLLRELELEPWVMTTGSRGYHVVVSLQRRADFDAVREFARDLGELAATREPRVFTNEQRKAKREGKILIDIQRNAYAHTSVAPYSVRPRPGAPVATPLHWEELEDPDTRADRWTLASVPGRVGRDGDPWAGIGASAQSLGSARTRLAEALSEARGSP